MQSVIACRVSRKMEVNKEAFLCVIMFCVANLCQESLRRTLTFSLSLQRSPKEFLFDSLKSLFFPWQRTTVGIFLPFYIFLISVCLLSLIWRPTLICIFIGRCTVWRESLFPADFFEYNSGGSSKDRPHHALLWLLLCFPVCDRNRRWQWLMHVGSTARRHRRNNIFIKLMEPTEREKESCVSLQDGFSFSTYDNSAAPLWHVSKLFGFLCAEVAQLHEFWGGVNL